MIVESKLLLFPYFTFLSWINDIVFIIINCHFLFTSTGVFFCFLSYFGFHIKKWNESGFRPPLCTYRLNWARRTSWGWWDEWYDTVLQTQDSKFEPWRSEAEHATSRSRRLPTILTFTRGWGRNILVSFKPPRPGTEPRTLAWKAAVLTTTLGPPPHIKNKSSVSQSVRQSVSLSLSSNCFLYHSLLLLLVFFRPQSLSMTVVITRLLSVSALFLHDSQSGLHPAMEHCARRQTVPALCIFADRPFRVCHLLRSTRQHFRSLYCISMTYKLHPQHLKDKSMSCQLPSKDICISKTDQCHFLLFERFFLICIYNLC